MLTVVSPGGNFKRTCLQTLLWSGLLFQSSCDSEWTGGSTSELGILGPPILHISTITITTTIAYNPAAAPPDSMYSLLGCYSRGQGPGNPKGNLFGKEGDYVVLAALPDGQLTIRACLEGCDELDPPKKTADHYGLVGLSNGRECFCGLKLVAEARKLTLEDCNMPCTGDSELSCGGADTVAVYTLIPVGESSKVTSHDKTQDSSQSDEKGDESATTPVGTTLTGTSLSSAVDTSAALKATDGLEPTGTKPLSDSQETSGMIIIPSSSLLPSAMPSDPPEAPTTGPAIAAITGSVSGAIILAAFIVLCVRAYKRKKLQEAARNTEVILIPENQHEDNGEQLPRRPVPSAIDTKGYQLRDLNKGTGRVAGDGHERGHGKRDEDLSTGASTDGAYLVPSTPALESGTRLRHPEHSARLTTTSLPTSESDTLYNKLMDEVRGGPATVPVATPSPSSPPPSATSSSVQWRGNPLKPLTPSAASAGQFDFDFNANAKPGVSSPAPAARPEATLGDRAWHRRKISTTFQPPASGPPSMPLPPTPPRRQQQGYASVHFTPTPASRVKPGHGQHNDGEKKKKEGPRAAALPAALPLGLVVGPAGQSSAPATPALKDSPTMPRALRDSKDSQDSRRGEGLVGGTGRGMSGGEGIGEVGGMQPLPPSTPAGRQSDSRPNRDTIYTVGEEEEGDWPVGGGNEANGPDDSPASATTVGTSILFPSDDEHDE
ncbi:hypothetical protein F5Y00DRAFT_265192 [Daldinia vernicosa]|uniref:uncharacterized protein n=1 Tax=Daldinia vernicosa TaxID=114800 RepID=UPI002007967B|nr:uncharacterized protein F5Y00DRAFT_265192 [Daldinia vernicosa]KAI0845858.1 hypothetical protein F5Y00DRAFT_265192 [Daldinia vernicosa]